MRVAFIAPAPFDMMSGGYVYDRHVVDGLRALGHDVSVHELAGAHPLPDTASMSAARELWNNVPADAIPVIDGLGLPSFAGQETILAARRCVGLIHHPTALETGQDIDTATALMAAERLLFPSLERIVVPSPATAECLKADFDVAAGRIVVVTPGTDPAPRSAGSGGSSCHILSVGSLIPRKGHDVLLKSLARLFDLDWRLTIVGSPDHAPAHARELMSLANELGIAQRVTFIGVLVGGGLEAWWHQADLFALATHYEGFGMVVAEALAHGLPVAVSEGGAASGLITPEVGVICTAGDVDQLSKALRRLIFDTALRRDLADAAWAVGRTLPDWTAQAARFAAALEGIG